MSNFATGTGRRSFLLPPSVEEWLPERHLARIRGRGDRHGPSRRLKAISRLGLGVRPHPSMLLRASGTSLRQSPSARRSSRPRIAAFRRRFLADRRAVARCCCWREAGVAEARHGGAGRHQGVEPGQRGRNTPASSKRLKAEELMALAEADRWGGCAGEAGCRCPRNWPGARIVWPASPRPRR